MNVEELRNLCLSMPKVSEDLKWGNNLCFLVAEKIFCLTDLDSYFSTAFKVQEEDFEELTARDGITQASHFARRKWVVVTEPDVLTDEEWFKFLNRSYELVRTKLPKKIKEGILKRGIGEE